MPSTQPSKNIGYAVIGTTLEWYDLSLFGLMVAYFPSIIFPFLTKPKAQFILMLSYFCSAVFKIVGGNILAYLADRYGRKLIFITSSAMMTFSTLLMACFPTQLQQPLLTLLLFFLIRILSGASSGVETTGALVFSYEHAKKSHRTLGICAVYLAIYLGYLLADCVCYVITSQFSEPQLLQYAWRLPYFIAVGIGTIIIFCRYHIEESPEFLAAEKNPKSTYGQALKRHALLIVCAIGIYVLATSLDQFLDVCNFYFIELFHYTLHSIYHANIIITLVTCCIILLAQFFIKPQQTIYVLIGVIILLALIAAPAYWLLSNQREWSYILVNISNDMPESIVFLCITLIVCRSCPTEFRTSALTLIQSISTAIGAAFPILISHLIYKLATPYWFPIIIWSMCPVMLLSTYPLYRLQKKQSS